MIESGQIRRAILVAGENGAPLVNETIEILNRGNHDRKSIKPFFANLTIGAGAVAWSIVNRDLVSENQPTLGAWSSETDTSHNDLCEGDVSGDSLVMQTDSEELLHAGISVAKRAWSKFLKVNAWNPKTPNSSLPIKWESPHSFNPGSTFGRPHAQLSVLSKSWKLWVGLASNYLHPCLRGSTSPPQQHVCFVRNWQWSFKPHAFTQFLKTPPFLKEVYPFTPSRFSLESGHSLSYLDEGKEDSLPTIFLHGNPTWSLLPQGSDCLERTGQMHRARSFGLRTIR